MSALVVFTVPVRAVAEVNAREHWRARQKRAKEHRRATMLHACAASMVRPQLPVVVTLTRLAPRRMDSDNAVGACKHVRDGVADWLGVNDGDPRIEWVYGQEASRTYGVRVSVLAVDAGRAAQAPVRGRSVLPATPPVGATARGWRHEAHRSGAGASGGALAPTPGLTVLGALSPRGPQRKIREDFGPEGSGRQP